MFTKLLNIVRDNKVILLIIALAVALRFSYLTYNPPSLNWDEVSHGFNAYSILKTQNDEWGVRFPTIFRAYGDYKLPVYIYLTLLSELVFGVNSFAVRLPSVLAGIATVLFTYLLTKKLFNREVAIISSFLVAVEPWSLFLSRGAFEANLALAFIVSGVYFFIQGLEKKNFLTVSGLLFGLSVWTYNSARIFVPLLLLTMALIYKKELVEIWKKDVKSIIYCLVPIVFLFIPMFFQLVNPVGQARYGKVAIIDEGAVNQINESRSKSKFEPLVSRIIYNKATYFVLRFSQNWFSHFSYKFLFTEGGTNYQFSISQKGLIYLIDLPFFIIGLIFLLRKKTRGSVLVLSWLLISPIASSITREAPHVLRSIVMLPIPMIISSLGLFWFVEKIPNKSMVATTMLYSIVVLAFLENYLTNYFTSYRNNYSWSWQYGYKEVVDFARGHYDKYDKIIVTKKYGEPHEFFLFYWPWDPAKYLSDPNLIRFNQSNWYWVDRFDKFYFINDWQMPKSGQIFVLESKGKVDCAGQKCLLVTSPDNHPEGWKKLSVINFLDNKIAFEIYENE